MEKKLSDKQIANALIRWGYSAGVIEYLDRLPNLDQKWLINTLIRNDEVDKISSHIHNFTQLDKKRVIDKIIKSHLWLEGILRNFGSFAPEDINQRWLLKALLKARNYQLIFDYVEKFEKINHQWLLDQVFKTEHRLLPLELESLFKNLHKFSDIDYQKLVLEIIDHHLIDVMMKSFEFIKDEIDQWRLVKTLIEKSKSHRSLLSILFMHLSKLDKIDHKRLVEVAVKSTGGLICTAIYMDQLKGVDQKRIAEQLIERGWRRTLKREKEKFTEVDPDWLEHVLKMTQKNRSVALKYLWVDTKELQQNTVEK